MPRIETFAKAGRDPECGYGALDLQWTCVSQAAQITGRQQVSKLDGFVLIVVNPSKWKMDTNGFDAIVTALAETSMANFMLDFADDYDENVTDSSAVVANGGLILNALFHGRVLCGVAGNIPSHLPAIGSANC
ncbi:hypothetical protein PC116_g21506 [Phytophthora cactorum]|uniref:Uncharacterized protein n=1 Tax=Phytophthora cactorum TaxID=29920 RepID=A0A8T1BRF0_9STRA|nr:hypothetical protein PC112_g18117 [Phytophthora cactorum]KAG2851742.1 hypothetical protein PC113_g15645 [Phytophthora cactorum]KAG2908804.1 hypothetical protein PC117_g19851 [Phytophthora cactorum]KAG2968017.1 hypothetical protein PC118_g18266 [Phytophthora cactorum]KAG2992632.1 hypothetical protein PC119_g18641 [Phytophthora cactorum]